MKIAHITCTFPPYKGGIGNTVFNIVKRLQERGHKVTVFTPAYKDQISENYGLNIVRLKSFLRYGNGSFLPQLFSRIDNFDIVQFHYPFFGGMEPVWFNDLIKKRKYRLLVHYHMDINKLSWPAEILSLPSKLIRSSFLNASDAITCASIDYVKNSQIKRMYQNNPDKFFEIPFGVDSEQFKPDDNWQKKKNKILFVGALDTAHYFKGLEILLKAIAKINNYEFSLVVVGGGNLLEFYKRLSLELNIDKKIKFVGSVHDNNLPTFYNQADFLILPSINQHEAFGLVLLEAMASGIPVIASNLPGVRTVFTDGQEGLLVEAGNPNDLAKKIELLLKDNYRRWKMCQSSRNLVENKYSWTKTADRLIELYDKIYTNKII